MRGVSSVFIQSARGKFFGKGELPTEEVGQPILRSWLRCAEIGLEQSRAPRFDPLSGHELHVLCERHERLRRMCRSEFDALNVEARDTGGIVILANAEGIVLDAVGDVAFAGQAAEVALRPGVSWNESLVGTNAIGAALAERRPVAVHGAEHFFELHQILSCAAVPITDPRGVIVGVLDLSAHASVMRVHALGLVRLAVDQIEHRFFDRVFDGYTVLRFHSDPAVIGAPREGILVFDEAQRLIAANRRGLSFVRRDWAALDEAQLDELFDDAPKAAPHPMELFGADGSRYFAVVKPPSRGHANGLCTQGSENGQELCVSGSQCLRDAEISTMKAALEACGGNVSQAARQLGVHRSTLYRRLLGSERDSRAAPAGKRA
ncbi:sigma-54-dependent Fis family transcriptional regulator [Hyphomicrobium sp.]|uniref:sigma-54-dependent Fis family transcriptional regulator n=1 Tax=Hyphomicrobium sp. TaxID=82 RepID=UPI00132BA7FB|nr:helix-turn-helix domain-containing protein [Hyphomicrobium sp.]KAB2937164.1 MAG: GAF domain-containing protein [Hyphomicrobium sp.]